MDIMDKRPTTPVWYATWPVLFALGLRPTNAIPASPLPLLSLSGTTIYHMEQPIAYKFVPTASSQ